MRRRTKLEIMRARLRGCSHAVGFIDATLLTDSESRRYCLQCGLPAPGFMSMYQASAKGSVRRRPTLSERIGKALP